MHGLTAFHQPRLYEWVNGRCRPKVPHLATEQYRNHQAIVKLINSAFSAVWMHMKLTNGILLPIQEDSSASRGGKSMKVSLIS